MKTSFHPNRQAAQKSLDSAKALWMASETEDQEAERHAAYMDALRVCVKMEAEHPTPAETKRRNDRAYLDSIGLSA
jgi:hypothetical protein